MNKEVFEGEGCPECKEGIIVTRHENKFCLECDKCGAMWFEVEGLLDAEPAFLRRIE